MSATNDQRRALELFDRLLDLPPDQRDEWIERHAAEDPELGRQLRALLAGHEVDEGPLDQAPVPTAGETVVADEVRARLGEALAERYELEEELGRGGMAIVFRARELKHDRPVVLKALRPELRAFMGEDRFQREVRIASRMSHPNIIGLIDSGTAAGLPFFVMPFVEGETLRSRLDREGPLSREGARSILLDIATGLAHAHRLGIVHRDLKPENVLCAGDHAYIMDFGIARPAEGVDRDNLTRPGLAIGTPRYMSPEQQAGEPVDHRTDLYAWGLLARELTGGEIPPPWVSVVSACLANDPSARPRNADALVRALSDDRAGLAGLGALGARAWPWAAAGLALALLAVGALVRSGPDAPASPADPDSEETASLELATPFAVAPFLNRTDDPNLDMLGRLAADWIVQGLQQADVGPVVPWSTTRAAAADVAGNEADGAELANDLGMRLGAGTVISGSIYEVGEKLSFAAVVTDPRARRVIAAPTPISASRDSAEAAIRELRDRILGSLAIRQDPLFARLPGVSGRPPLLEAYRAYERGVELFDAQDYGAAQREYERAFALDTSFLAASLSTVAALWNQGKLEQVDSLLAFLETRRDRLAEYHDLRRRSFVAQREGDGERAYRLELRRAELGPTPRGSYSAARLANQLNRAEDAVRLLVDLDPNGPGLRGWAQYWTQLAHGYHDLGRYDEELEAAQEMWARFPERRVATVLAARALAAAGRTAELDSLIAAVRLLPPDTYWSLAAVLVVAGEEARAHRGAEAEARDLLRGAVNWLEGQLEQHPDHRVHRYWLASAYYDLEDFTMSRRLFRELVRDHPDRGEYRTGALVSLAQLEGTESLRPELRELPRVTGGDFAALARIEAGGGNRERALSLLSEALRRGIASRTWLHALSLPDLGRFADDPRYVQALREIHAPTSTR